MSAFIVLVLEKEQRKRIGKMRELTYTYTSESFMLDRRHKESTNHTHTRKHTYAVLPNIRS